MPRKLFLEHVNAFKTNAVTVDGIGKVTQGHDDGEFTFQLEPPLTSSTINVTTYLNLDEYPKSHTYLFYAQDDVSPALAKTLEESSSLSAGKSLHNTLQELASSIRDKCREHDLIGDGEEYEDSDQDMDVDEDEDEDEDEEGEQTNYDTNFDNDAFFGYSKSTHQAATSAYGSDPTSSGKLSNSVRLRLCRDVTLAKKSGFKVAYTPDILTQSQSYLFLSIRIFKLGLSDDAIKAWHLEKNKYLILAICYRHGYISFDDVLREPTASTHSFQVGICSSYKPDLSHFYHQQGPQTGTAAPRVATFNESTKKIVHQWEPVFIAAPLQDLFTSSFVPIICHRRDGSLPWFNAEKLHLALSRAANPELLDYSDCISPEVVKRSYPDIVTSDHLANYAFYKGTASSVSYPLVAMQYLLRRFVRCTEFCLICHSALTSNIEAIRPYVCDEPLCLYRYMTLGFGPKIEHEIRAQPEVVDLLVSMCWASATAGSLKTFPDGLGIILPDVNASTPLSDATSKRNIVQNAQRNQAEAKCEKARLVFDEHKCELYYTADQETKLKSGDWIMIKGGDTDVKFHIKVLDVNHPFVKLSRLHLTIPTTITTATNKVVNTDKRGLSFGGTNLASLATVTIFRYDTDLKDMTKDMKCESIARQLNLLPSILELKKWLESHPGSLLADWKERLSPAILGILRWIIASNRSCILPTDDAEKVGGMGSWSQFRLAMGAPDKEQRFELATRNKEVKLNPSYPTLFAWHGSGVQNWHSIIREGLNFDDIANARSFGHGVYHSLSYSFSLAYTEDLEFGRSYNCNHTTGPLLHWRNSASKPKSVLAMSEIINAPSQFVSSSPHLVVNQLDWIQVRYLFVQGYDGEYDKNLIDAADVKQYKIDRQAVGRYVDQDPKMRPVGPLNEEVLIPIAAIPVPRRSLVTVQGKQEVGGKGGKDEKSKDAATHSVGQDVVMADMEDDCESIATLAEDLTIFGGVDVSQKTLPEFLVQLEEKESVNQVQEVDDEDYRNDDIGDDQVEVKTSAIEEDFQSSTGFSPGKLNYSSLPLFRAPTNAQTETTKQLMRQFRSLIRTMNTTSQKALGWYTDPDQVDNVYQLIVELHSFDKDLPITRQMVERKISSVVLELRFPPDYPFKPPFVRVIRPRFLPFLAGGGGHLTAGGSLCMELLTTKGWLPAYDLASVIMQVRMAICSTDPRPARLEQSRSRGGYWKNGDGIDAMNSSLDDYGIGEATSAYVRACQAHGWPIPSGFLEGINELGQGTYKVLLG